MNLLPKKDPKKEKTNFLPSPTKAERKKSDSKGFEY